MSTDTRIKNYWREEFALVALFALFFLAVIGFALPLPFDARLFPLVIGVAGIGLTLIITVQEWHRHRLQVDEPDANHKDDTEVEAGWLRLSVALLSAPAFGLLFWLFGFFVASLAAMLLMPPLMGYSDRRMVLIVGVATVACLALFFPYLVGVNLPHGLVGDWLIDTIRPN